MSRETSLPNIKKPVSLDSALLSIHYLIHRNIEYNTQREMSIYSSVSLNLVALVAAFESSYKISINQKHY